MTFDDVKNPAHYSGNGLVSCKDALASMMSNVPTCMSAETAYWWGCAMKYIWRWPNKNVLKDIDKAIQCLHYMKDAAIADIAESKGITVEELVVGMVADDEQ